MHHERRRWGYRWLLVITNVAFLSAPWVARAGGREPTEGTARRRSPSHSAPSKGQATRAPSPRPTPRPSGRLGKPAPSSDDDDGGKVAGDVAFACCSAMVGAMAEASSAEDVELEEPEEPPREPYPEYPDTPPIPPAPAGPAFSTAAAREAIARADQRSRVACAPSLGPADAVVVRVRFTPSGAADAVRFEPAWPERELDRCMTEAFLACEVPAFTGEAVTVKKTLEATTTGSASPSP